MNSSLLLLAAVLCAAPLSAVGFGSPMEPTPPGSSPAAQVQKVNVVDAGAPSVATLWVGQGPSATIDAKQREAASVASGIVNADWSVIAPPGFERSLFAALAAGGAVYVAGSNGYSPAGRTGGIARWDGAAWSSVGGGFDADVVSLAFDEQAGQLYAGGHFFAADGQPVRGVARWDGAAWSALGSGLDGAVRSLAWDPQGRRLFAGGEFGQAGGLSTGALAEWDGSVWRPVGSLRFGAVQVLHWNPSTQRLLVGGAWQSPEGEPAGGLIEWDGQQWSVLPEAEVSGDYFAVDPASGRIFALGDFESVLKVFDAGVWTSHPLPQGLRNIEALHWDPVTQALYLGTGYDRFAGQGQLSPPFYGIARWSGEGWSTVGGGLRGDGAVAGFASDPIHGRLVVLGHFEQAGGIAVSNVAAWDGQDWAAFGASLDGAAWSLALDPEEPALYVGGRFGITGLAGGRNLAKWNGSEWSVVGGGTNEFVGCLAWDPGLRRLFAGGWFTRLDPDGASLLNSSIAVWTGGGWIPSIGGGFRQTRCAWDASNAELVMLGEVGLARWGAQGGWRYATGLNSLNNGQLALDASGARVFVLGQSGGAGSETDVFVWNGEETSRLHFPLVGNPRALAWDEAGQRIYLSGLFDGAEGGVLSRHLFMWNGMQWTDISETLPADFRQNGVLNSLAINADNGDLYALGFTPLSGDESQREVVLFRLRGEQASVVFSGPGRPSLLTWDQQQGRLLFSGEFIQLPAGPAAIGALQLRTDRLFRNGFEPIP